LLLGTCIEYFALIIQTVIVNYPWIC
jgi:hypothetical protein